MLVSSAPGKIILGGEHAVVYGYRAIAIAIDRRLTIYVRDTEDVYPDNRNGLLSYMEHYLYPLKIDVVTDIPSSAGLGSSAAMSVAASAIKYHLKVNSASSADKIAAEAFRIESEYQKGRASPLDTTICTHGKAVIVNDGKPADFLWKIDKNDKYWKFYNLDMPEWKIIIVDSGIPKNTEVMVRNVEKVVLETIDGMDHIIRIDNIVGDMVGAINHKDLVKLGTLMTENEKELEALDVKHTVTDRIIKYLKTYCFGTKITGAGGGGSVIGLVENDFKANKVLDLMKEHGFNAFTLKTGVRGLTIENATKE